MIHTSPEELRTLEQKVEDARNALTLIEQDYFRLGRLHASEGYSIGEMRKEKDELSETIAGLSARKDALNIEVCNLELSREKTIREAEEAAASLAASLARSASESADRDQKRKEIEELGNSLIARHAAALERESSLSEKEALLDARHSKIRDFIASI